MPRLFDLYVSIEQQMHEAGFDDAKAEAKYFLKSVLGLSASDFLEQDQDVTLNKEFDEQLRKRLDGMPLSKVVGRKGFWTHDFVTNEHVLDPRPDTETLIESVLNDIDSSPQGRNHHWTLLDLGTGSGCIIITLLKELPNATAIAVDISADAIKTAQKNAANLGVEKRLRFSQGSWLEPVIKGHQGFKADIVVSNPPYIPSEDIATLDKNVRDYDPILALDGGADGMICYDAILKNMKGLIHPQSLIYLEAGVNQKEQITRIVKNYGFAIKSWRKDLNGIDRICTVQMEQVGKK